jgi:hypothetical protein
MKIVTSILHSTLLIYNTYGNQKQPTKVEISAIGVRLAGSYGQAEKTHADSILQTENKIVNLQERK